MRDQNRDLEKLRDMYAPNTSKPPVSSENSEKTPKEGENNAEITPKENGITPKEGENNAEITPKENGITPKEGENNAENKSDYLEDRVINMMPVSKDIDTTHQTDSSPKEEPKPIEESETLGGEIKAKFGAAPSSFLDSMGGYALGAIDDIKSAYCASLTGRPPKEFKAPEKQLKVVHRSIVNFAKSKEIKPLTPFWEMVIAIAVWQAPLLMIGGERLGKALIGKFSKKNNQNKIDLNVPKEQPPKPKPKYSNVKEVKEGRKRFEIHATTGCYRFGVDGKPIKVAEAKEVPSKKFLLDLIEEGKSNKEILEILAQ